MYTNHTTRITTCRIHCIIYIFFYLFMFIRKKMCTFEMVFFNKPVFKQFMKKSGKLGS